MKKNAVLAAIGAFSCLTGLCCRADAAAIGFSGAEAFIVSGSIGNLTNLCGGAGCDSGFVPFTTGDLLADGMVISGNVRQLIRDNGANTTSALLQLTDILATNTGSNTITDKMFLVSDQFSPSLAGPVGVGIFGSFLSNAGPLGNINFALVQGEINYLTTGLITQENFGGVLSGFTLGTGAPFASCFSCSPVPFAAANFGVDAFGGVEQLIGGIKFTLGPGASIAMPGSFLITDNNNQAILSETPEPATLSMLVGALCLMGFASLREACAKATS